MTDNLNTPHKGICEIGDQVYSCHVIDGVRYIDGKEVNEFIKTLTPEQMTEMFLRGLKEIKEEKKLNQKQDSD